MARKDDLVGVAEIMEMARVSKQSVWIWTRMPHMGFPEPVAMLAMGPVYSRPEVQRWLDARQNEAGHPARKRKR